MRPLVFGSVCSGIDAASVAWTSKFGGPLNWECAFFSEIDPWAKASLASNFPMTPDYGDLNNYERWPDHGPRSARPIDLLIGGTPCQSYSVAGLRKGLNDPRGQLMLTFVNVLARYRPRIFIFENVGGLLSSEAGRNFASFLAAVTGQSVRPPRDGWKNAGVLSGIPEAYGIAYRVLDAQYVRVDGFERAVPQRRRRVIVVGYLGDWRRAAGILLEPEGMSGNPPPRRKAHKGHAGNVGDSSDESGEVVSAARMAAFGEYVEDGTASTIKARDYKDATDLVASTLTANGDAHSGFRDDKGLVPVAFNSRQDPISGDVAGPIDATLPQSQAIAIQSGNSKQNGRGFNDDGVAYTVDTAEPQAVAAPVAPTVTQGPPYSRTGNSRVEAEALVAEPITLAIRGRGGTNRLEYRQDGTANTLLTPNGGRAGIGVGAIAVEYAVRRITETECERLQGFPDGFTNIPWRGKNGSPKGKRYMGLGNSMAVNKIRWLGVRIEMMDKLLGGRD